MSKIGEIVFTDGGRVDILALVGYHSRTFVQVVTPIGLYAFSLRKNYIPGGYAYADKRIANGNISDYAKGVIRMSKELILVPYGA